MIAEELLELQDARPFVPFEVHLADGKTFIIAHPKWMMVPPPMNTLYYVHAEGPLHRVAIHQITRIVERAADDTTSTAARA
jgi:hypothetical protein